jgi:integrase
MRVGENPAVSQSQSVDRYLDELHTLRKYSTFRVARRILLDYLDHANPQDVRAGVISYLKACKEKGNTPDTIEHKRIRIKAFYAHMGVRLNVPRFKVNRTLPEIYSQEELDTLFSGTAGQEHWLYKTFLMAGLRCQEAQHLERGNLLEGGLQIISKPCTCKNCKHEGRWSPKDHEERIVRVPNTLIQALRALPRVKGSNLVFPSKLGTADTHILDKLKKTAKRLGMNPAEAWCHRFRANYATALLRGGLDVRTVAQQLGHNSLAPTLRYLALLDSERLGDKIEAVWKI